MLAGTAGLTKTTGDEVVLSGMNTYTGATVVNAGRLVLGVSSALSGSTSLTVNGGELALGVTVQGVGAVVLNDGMISGGSLTGTDYLVKKGAVSSVLAGSAGLTKATGDEVVLSGMNTYSGATVLNAGRLVLGVSGAMGGTSLVLFTSPNDLELPYAFISVCVSSSM